MLQKGIPYGPNPVIAQVQILCDRHEFVECLAYIEEHLEELESEEQEELYLIRAQIKIFTGDETILDDLKAAKKLLPGGAALPGGGTLPAAGTGYISDTSNLFIVFSARPGSVSRFKVALQKSIPLFQKLCGDACASLAMAMEADILYHTGHIEKALSIAAPVYSALVEANQYYMAMVVGFILIRCHIAQGNPKKTEQVIAQLAKYSRILSKPRLKEVYKTVQGWINCTTGYMGAYPRFLRTPDGLEHCVLDLRTQMMLADITERGHLEGAVVRCARHSIPDAFAVKELYANLYNAMLLFQLGKREGAVALFYEQYMKTQKNRVIMAFAEYGKQILPLLQYALGRPDGDRFARRWSDKLNQMATQYEESLCVIRGEQKTANIIDAFTDLEIDVLRGLTNNLTISQTAELVHISADETKEHIRSIYRKLGVHNRTEAVAKAVGAHIITPADAL